MCMFWANHFAKFPRVIHSIDTDVMPLAVHMQTICNVVDSGPLLWKYNAKTHMDLKKLTNVLYRKENMVGHDFLLWCILGGTDYFEKVIRLWPVFSYMPMQANAFAQIGCSRILEIVKTAGPGTVKMVPPAAARVGHSFHKQASAFREFVLHGRGEVIEASGDSVRRKKSCPSDAQIAKAFKEFSFTYNYWSVPWNEMTRSTAAAAVDESSVYHSIFAMRRAGSQAVSCPTRVSTASAAAAPLT